MEYTHTDLHKHLRKFKTDPGSRERMLMPKALFTSKIFEGIEGDYPVFQNFSDRLFTSPGLERIIPGYPHKSSPH
jgi:hypothetical protein